MSTVILSPHTDDAVFSLADHLCEALDVTVVSVFAGIPDDDIGKRKHTRLRAEHQTACVLLGWRAVNGDFLDDVYQPRPADDVLAAWISEQIDGTDTVYAPLGIHHPDHIHIARVAAQLAAADSRTWLWYAELPYTVDYPELARSLAAGHTIESVSACFPQRKEAAVRCYTSQVNDDVLNRVMRLEMVLR